MKRYLIGALCAINIMLFTQGCSVLSPEGPVTWEAAKFNSFKSVWISTLALYDYQMDLRVQGKIKPSDAQDIDTAWNSFRAAYRVALAQASGDENAFTPENVRKLADDVLTLIYASQ